MATCSEIARERRAALSIAKSHSPAAPVPLGAVTWTLVVTNTGSDTLTSVTVTDTLPGQAAFAGETNPGGYVFAQAGQVVSWTKAIVLVPGATQTFTVDATLGCAGGAVSNEGYALAATSCGSLQMGSGTDSFVLAAPTLSLAVVKTRSPASPVPGGPVTYTLLVTNTGSATVTSLAVSDTLAGAVTFTSQSNSGGLAWNGATSGVLAWTGVLALAPAATVTVTVDGTLACAGSVVTNVAWARGGNGCGTSEAASPQDVFTLPAPGTLAGTLTVPTTVTAGQILTVRLTLSNAGGASMTDIRPALAFVSGAGLVTGTLVPVPAGPGGPLAPGSSTVFTWTFNAVTAGTVAFSASWSG
ncbi:MAG: hypothetical protein AAB368_02070, partial [bacterium]